jgi:hypothetical protein
LNARQAPLPFDEIQLRHRITKELLPTFALNLCLRNSRKVGEVYKSINVPYFELMKPAERKLGRTESESDAEEKYRSYSDRNFWIGFLVGLSILVFAWMALKG